MKQLTNKLTHTQKAVCVDRCTCTRPSLGSWSTGARCTPSVYGHLLSISPAPSSSYSCLDIHSCWNDPSCVKMEPPVQLLNRRSNGGATRMRTCRHDAPHGLPQLHSHCPRRVGSTTYTERGGNDTGELVMKSLRQRREQRGATGKDNVRTQVLATGGV